MNKKSIKPPVKAQKNGTATVTRKRLGEDAPVKTFIYEVESGVIMSPRVKSTDNPFPFEKMKVGDSFLIPAYDKIAKSPNPVHYAANRYAKHVKPGFAVTTRLALDKSRRVWRIK